MDVSEVQQQQPQQDPKKEKPNGTVGMIVEEDDKTDWIFAIDEDGDDEYSDDEHDDVSSVNEDEEYQSVVLDESADAASTVSETKSSSIDLQELSEYMQGEDLQELKQFMEKEESQQRVAPLGGGETWRSLAGTLRANRKEHGKEVPTYEMDKDDEDDEESDGPCGLVSDSSDDDDMKLQRKKVETKPLVSSESSESESPENESVQKEEEVSVRGPAVRVVHC